MAFASRVIALAVVALLGFAPARAAQDPSLELEKFAAEAYKACPATISMAASSSKTRFRSFAAG